jgi:hypothetical protein
MSLSSSVSDPYPDFTLGLTSIGSRSRSKDAKKKSSAIPKNLNFQELCVLSVDSGFFWCLEVPGTSCRLKKKCLGSETRSGSDVFGPPGSVSQRYGSGSFYHQAKIVTSKTTLDTSCYVTFYDFLSLKNYVNLPSKSNEQKYFFVGVLKVSGENNRNRIRGMDPRIRIKNVADPQHCLEKLQFFYKEELWCLG